MHLPFEYYNLILHTFERPILTYEDGVRSFGGVNESYYPGWKGWPWLPANPEDAYNWLWDFYRERWNTVKAGMLQPPLDLFYFDFAFNSGGRTACRELQGLLNAMGANLVVDGLMGPRTARAAVMARSDMARYLIRRLKYLSGLGQKWELNARGWSKRVGKLMEYL